MDNNEAHGLTSAPQGQSTSPTSTPPSGDQPIIISSGSTSTNFNGSDNSIGSNNNPSHPFFANHPTQTFSSNASDIIVSEQPQKHSHRKLILILVLVGVIVLCIAIAAVLLVNHFSTLSKIDHFKQSFSSYQNLLEYGSANATTDNSSWFIQQVIQKNYQPSADFNVDEYSSTLLNQHQSFLDASAEISGSLDSSLKDAIKENSTIFSAYMSFLRLGDLNAELMDVYIAQGDDAANQFIGSAIAFTHEDFPILSTMSTALKDYLLVELEIYQIYSAQGCFLGNDLDTACIGTIDAGATGLSLLGTEANQRANYLQNLSIMVASTLKTNTLEVKNQIEDFHE